MEWRPVFIKGLEKDKLSEMINQGFTVADLNLIKTSAIKLEISGWETRPTVDILYDIALRLSIFEQDIISPLIIIDKIKEYVEANQ